MKKILYGIGIMTGTSCDAVDISYVEFNEESLLKISLVDFFSIKLTNEYSNKVKEIIENKISIQEISQFNFYYSKMIVDAVMEFISKKQINYSEVDFVAVHGQTLWHNPIPTNFLGKEIISTYQAVNLSFLAKYLEKPVIGDFRSGDIAFGGQGAPLVPIFDSFFFKSKDKTTICLNLGGIANMTVIPFDKSVSEIIAYDIGPANTLIDLVSSKYFGIQFDKNGDLASQGAIDKKLLAIMLDDEYFKLLPPKSTGREKFNAKFIENSLQKLNYLVKPIDLLRTVTELTATTIANAINDLQLNSARLVISGGGKNNKLLISSLLQKLSNVEVKNIEDYGISSEAKESVAFAYLGWLFLKMQNGNLPSVTGATKSTILGTLAI
ncbi:MAG: anhydro-N-acetylmuramic acid kinase [Candidatus Kapaibacteriota bacterium]